MESLERRTANGSLQWDLVALQWLRGAEILESCGWSELTGCGCVRY